VITGHSLGGGTATLLTMLFMIHPPPVWQNNIISKLKTYCFGPVKVLSKEFIPLFDGILVNIFNQYDLVPRLDCCTIKDKILIQNQSINQNPI